ncbi:hypothetical protein NliqN6_3157 [Naganishia liquefaciens]|uniref:Major facilitator superfamily (MFS) profile domain-containing protein n=1 Tax=Naganishia liquefaciens TaxID=104408 RepID=A0A8H3YEN1_9TREE|nr:hypothetical protein NliqN6_3157 [Naganishia liquefaciens]
MSPASGIQATERAPLLRSNTQRSTASYYAANDSSFTRYAAETAVNIEEGAADPLHENPDYDSDAEEEVIDAEAPGTGKGPCSMREMRIRGRLKVIILIGLWASNFTFAVQTSAIPTLAPRISASFSHSELASYLGSIFPLFSTAFTPIYGVLLDTLGRKTAMLVAGFLYGLGTIACSLSPSMGWLIAARAVAGAGGAGLLTVSSVITTDLTSLRSRGHYQGLMMIVFGTGASVGGPVSGWIADVANWRWSFMFQIPFLLLSMIIICIYLPSSPPHSHIGSTAPRRPTLQQALADFDFLGTATLLVAISSLLLGLSNHTAFLYEWRDTRVWALLLISLITTAVFLLVEWKVAVNPVVPLQLFKGWRMSSIYASNFMLSVAAQSFLYQIPVFFTVILSTTSAVAGAHLLPNSIGLAVGSFFAGQLIKRTGRYALLSIIGLAMPIISIFLASFWNEETAEWKFAAEVLPAGLGYSIFLCCSLVALIAEVDKGMMPKATSVLYTVRSLGNTVGIALSASIQQAVLVRDLREVLKDRTDREQIIISILHSKTAIGRYLTRSEQVAAEAAYGHSLSLTFVAASVFALVTLIASLPTRERNLGEQKISKRSKDSDDPHERSM